MYIEAMFIFWHNQNNSPKPARLRKN